MAKVTLSRQAARELEGLPLVIHARVLSLVSSHTSVPRHTL